MQGWVKLHRCLKNKAIFDNEKLLKVHVWCLLKATHKPHIDLVGRQKVQVEPGQFVTGRFKAATELSMAPSTAWEYLKLLEDNKTINIKSNNKYSVVTIVNWGLYQSEDEKSDTKSDNTSDSKSTANQQQIDTYKNEKNVKNEKTLYAGEFEELWESYPNRKGKAVAQKKFVKLREKFSLEELTRTVERYAKEVSGKDKQYMKYGSTFFNGGFVDYLDKNYEQKQKPPKGKDGHVFLNGEWYKP